MERICKDEAMANLQYYLSMYKKGLRKTTTQSAGKSHIVGEMGAQGFE
jgi:hypothetical protein